MAPRSSRTPTSQFVLDRKIRELEEASDVPDREKNSALRAIRILKTELQRRHTALEIQLDNEKCGDKNELILRHGEATEVWQLAHVLRHDPYSRLFTELLSEFGKQLGEARDSLEMGTLVKEGLQQCRLSGSLGEFIASAVHFDAPEHLLHSLLPSTHVSSNPGVLFEGEADVEQRLTPKGRASVFAALRRRIGQDSAWGDLQRWVLNDLVNRSLTGFRSPYSPESAIGIRVANRAFGPNGYGRESLQLLLGEDGVDFLTVWANALHATQQHQLERIQKVLSIHGPADALVGWTLLSILVFTGLAFSSYPTAGVGILAAIAVFTSFLYYGNRLLWRRIFGRCYRRGDPIGVVEYAWLFSLLFLFGAVVGWVVSWLWKAL